VCANLIITQFGPVMAIPVAFLFIGLDLTARDHLHEAWHRRGLVWKMVLLIGTGSALSWFLNRDAGRIAIASFTAFACAGVADAIVYQLLGDRARMLKINGSNVVSAAVDSVIFPALAFGFPLLWPIMLGQFAAKTLGGAVWSVGRSAEAMEAAII
jgi:uncharacterized PurR-regulated membrane protein YhhQ (DUF165 family)